MFKPDREKETKSEGRKGKEWVGRSDEINK